MIPFLLALLAAGTPLSDPPSSALVDPDNPENPLGAAIVQTGLQEHTRRVQALLQAAPAEFAARSMLPIAHACFAAPWKLPDIGEAAATSIAEAGTPFHRLARFAAHAFGGQLPPPPGAGADAEPAPAAGAESAPPAGAPTPASASTLTPAQGFLPIPDPQGAIFALDFLLNPANLVVRTAMAEAGVDVTPEQVTAVLNAALQTTSRRNPQSASGGAHLETIATTLNAAVGFINAQERSAMAAIAAHLDVGFNITGDWTTFEPDDLPEKLQDAVTGTILACQPVPELGWLVVGGLGDNTYDMTRIAAVYDPGGNDTYIWTGTVAGSRLVVDVAGNDTYTGDGVGGPAGALLGASLIIDLAGDDRYTGDTLALGAAAFGVGILMDHAGNDTYTARRWSIGSALGGFGALVDLEGIDLYDAPLFAQGAGGPCGVGLLLDCAGNDRYRADRLQPSAYGTPATFLAFSQGVSFGYRALPGVAGARGAAGGFGALIDLAGNDRYECGEFGQGCGYYLGLGLLHDAAGDDFYSGNRYAQGAAAHQAFGILDDGAGDDIYHGVTAANQGAGWDMSVGVLVDRGGNDTYRGGDLSQGAAAQQAIGMLLDLAGDDRYFAQGTAQGMAGGNEYHWDATRCPSFGLLWDKGGRNWFSSGRADGQCVRTGDAQDPPNRDGRTQWGLFLAR